MYIYVYIYIYIHIYTYVYICIHLWSPPPPRTSPQNKQILFEVAKTYALKKFKQKGRFRFGPQNKINLKRQHICLHAFVKAKTNDVSISTQNPIIPCRNKNDVILEHRQMPRFPSSKAYKCTQRSPRGPRLRTHVSRHLLFPRTPPASAIRTKKKTIRVGFS